MEIISQNYDKILKEMIFKQFYSNLKVELDKNLTRNNVFNYIDLLSSLDISLVEIAKKSLITIFETIDKGYCNSIERKHKYHIKAHLPRTILTIFGEITFTRTFYSNKSNKGSFCYLDRYLGLKKHDYFDPYIKATIIEYSSNNSIPTVCNMINDLIGNRIKLENKVKYLNRQTIRNIILDSKLSTPEKKQLETPEVLYIMADEKWVATQNNDKKKVMVKSIVVFDSIIKKPRNILNNKRIFASTSGNDFLNDALDYLYYTYNMDQIKTIYVMGDGAKWIKNLTSHFKVTPKTGVTFSLDKFHFKLAIHHIGNDEAFDHILADYIINNNKKDFILGCDELIKTFAHREKTIITKKDYILNNWNYIQNLYINNLSCPMESQISHNLAYLLTSRPKGYSLNMLDKILKIRLLFKNNENLKMLYLNNFNINEIKELKKETLNFDIYDKHKQFIPIYKDKLFTPTIGILA